MEPITLTIVAVFAIATAAAVVFWQKILGWAENSLFPWLAKNIPSIESSVRLAFSVVDKVTVAVRSAVKQAWSNLRQYLLKQTIELQRKSSSEWIKRVVSWVVKRLESGETVPVKVVTEEVVNTDDLPSDVREAWLRQQKETAELNITETRDKELMEMTA